MAGNCIELGPGFRATAGTAPTTFHAWVETAPTADSVSPSGSSGLAQQFTWKASSPSGYTNLSEMYALFNTSVSGVNACYIRYMASALLSLTLGLPLTVCWVTNVGFEHWADSAATSRFDAQNQSAGRTRAFATPANVGAVLISFTSPACRRAA